MGQSVTIPRGASVVEPGVTPRADTVLGPWPTWTQKAQDRALSRLWAGVHFQGARTAGAALGTASATAPTPLWTGTSAERSETERYVASTNLAVKKVSKGNP